MLLSMAAGSYALENGRFRELVTFLFWDYMAAEALANGGPFHHLTFE